MNIPKIIHYYWFGGKKKPESVIRYLKTKVIEWNERNFNINKCQFVSDYVRLKVL